MIPGYKQETPEISFNELIDVRVLYSIRLALVRAHEPNNVDYLL